MKLVWVLHRALAVLFVLGVPGAIAPGNGRLSRFARRIIAKVRLPPAEEPKIAMFLGGVIFVAAFHAVIASSSAAG